MKCKQVPVSRSGSISRGQVSMTVNENLSP